MSESGKNNFSGHAFDRSSVGAVPEFAGGFGSVSEEDDSDLVRNLPIDQVSPNFFQFRKVFVGIEELSENIKEHGIIHPLIVYRQGEKYLIACGERRYRAAKQAGLNKIPCIVKTRSRDALDEINFIENVQRSSFTALERYCAISEFVRRGYSARRIMQMSGEKHKATISRAAKAGDFINNAIAASFSTYGEMTDKVENISLNVLYKIATIATRDLPLAMETLNEIVEKQLSSNKGIDLAQAVLIKLGLTEDGEEGDAIPIPTGDPQVSFMETPVTPSVKEPAPFGVGQPGPDDEEGDGFIINATFEDNSPIVTVVPSSAVVAPTAGEQVGEQLVGVTDSETVEAAEVKPPKKPAKEKVQASYNETEWPDTRIMTVARQIDTLAKSLMNIEQITVLLTNTAAAEKALEAISSAKLQLSIIETGLVALSDRVHEYKVQSEASMTAE